MFYICVECRFLRGLGGDTVGMSTVPEIVAAKHCGMKILGLSLVTNKVIIGNEDTPAASHQEVMDAVRESGDNMERIVREFVTKQRIGEYLHSSKQPPVFDYKAHVPSRTTASSETKCEKKHCSKSCDVKDNCCHSSSCTVMCAAALLAAGFAGYMLAKRK